MRSALNHLTHLVFGLMFLGGLLPNLLMATTNSINIGVLTYRGSDPVHTQWQETINYLNNSIAGYRFRLRPLYLDQLYGAISGGEVDFVLTNSGSYVELEAQLGISRLLTLEPIDGGSAERGIASVVFTRRERDDLNELADLRDKRLLAVSELAFGGFQVIWRELSHYQIDPFTDIKQLEFSGFPIDEIVYSVLNGEADAGVIRACFLEKMATEGKIALERFKAISPKSTEGIDCLHSSRFYPNWPLAKSNTTPEDLAKKVAQVLLALPADSPPARTGGYAGWTVPVDYQPVHELFRELQIGPYAWRRNQVLLELWSRYWQWLALGVIALFWWIWHTTRVEFLVRRRTEQLKGQMDERRRAEERLSQQQRELAHVSRISSVGELASGMAHELNQPLSAINSYAQGSVWRLEQDHPELGEMIDVQKQIVAQAERAGTIIERFRGFLRNEEVSCRDVSLNDAIHEAVALFSSEAKRRGVSVVLELLPDLPPVCGEIIQIEQVLLNLMQNGAEVMEPLSGEERLLTLRSLIGDDETVIIEVENSGPALETELFHRLFTPFFTTKLNGVGIGLSLSRSIIESHGGAIYCVEPAEQGTIMRIKLPIEMDGDNE